MVRQRVPWGYNVYRKKRIPHLEIVASVDLYHVEIGCWSRLRLRRSQNRLRRSRVPLRRRCHCHSRRRRNLGFRPRTPQ